MSDIKVSVSLTLDDTMSAEATKALRDLVAAADKTGRAEKGVADAAKAAGKAAGAAGRESAAGTGKYVQGLRSAAAQSKAVTAATRAQGAAAREAAKAYETSARAARQAARAQKDVAEAVRRTDGTSLSRLSRTMDAIAGKGRALRTVFGGLARGAAQGIAQGVGQGLAHGMRGMGQAPVAYERRLSRLSNAAYADRTTVEGRRAGMAEISGAVGRAVNAGGGNRDSALEALEAMDGSKAVSRDAAMAMLPTLQKFATVSGASTSDIAAVAMRGIQDKFFTPEQVEEALNKALVAGKAGGFSLADMATQLPKLMVEGKKAGMGGMRGFERLLASLQASATTADGKAQAGGNLESLLSLMTRAQTARAFNKLYGVNLSGTLAAAAQNGQTPLDSFITLVDKNVVGKNKRFAALRAQAATAQGGEREAALAQMADILESSSVGTVIRDRAALLALAGEMGQRGTVQSSMDAMKNAAGAVDLDYALDQSTVGAKLDQAGHARDKAMQAAFEKLSPAIHALADGVTAASDAFPTFTSAVSTAATALGSIAALAAAYGGVSLLTRGRAGLGRTAGGATAGGTAGRAGKARRYRGAASSARKAAPSKSLSAGAKGRIGGAAGIAVLGAMDIAATENDESLTRAEKNVTHAENVGGTAGALALGAAGAIGGAKVGAVAGTAIGGPIGTAVGGLIGAIAGLIGSVGGHYIGSFLGRKAGEAAFADSEKEATGQGRAMPGAAKSAAAASGTGMAQVFPSMAIPGAQTGPDHMTLLDLSKLNLPSPQVTNHITVKVGEKEIAAMVEERMERYAIRGGY